MRRLVLLLLASLCVLAGCDRSPRPANPPSPDALVGVYGYLSKKSDRVIPLLKVTKEGSEYQLFEYGHGEWHLPRTSMLIDSARPLEPVRPVNRADLERLIRHPVNVEVSGLQTKALVFVHVPAGWSDGGRDKPFVTKSGYFAMTLVGPVDLQRM